MLASEVTLFSVFPLPYFFVLFFLLSNFLSQSPVSPGYEVCTVFAVFPILFYDYQCQCEEMQEFNQIRFYDF